MIGQSEPARTDFRLSGARTSGNLIAFAMIAAAVFGWNVLTDRNVGTRDMLLAAGGVLILVGLWNWRAARARARAAVDRAPRLSIGDDGLLIPDTFEQRIPWQAVTKTRVYVARGGEFAAFRIAAPQRYGFRPGLLTRIEHAVGLGVICSLGRLDGDAAAVAEALRRHAPARLTQKL